MKRSPMSKPDPDKLRAWQRRSAGLKRTGGLKRGKGIRRKNSERRAKSTERCYGDRGDAIRAMVCLQSTHDPAHRCNSPVRACHETARGGGAAKGDRFSLFPGCDAAHEEAGERPSLWYRSDPERYGATARGSWEAKLGIVLEDEVKAIADDLTAKGYR